jgi:hypothetical protein
MVKAGLKVAKGFAAFDWVKVAMKDAGILVCR